MKRRTNQPSGAQRGSSLLETLIALGILGAVAGAVLSALSTGSMSTATLDEQVTVESLARTQLETIKSSPYDPAGDYLPMDIPGYSISVNTVIIAGDKQEINVIISREGRPLMKVTDCKVDR